MLVLSVQQDFNGCDCADQQRDSLEEIVLDSLLCIKKKAKFVAGKLCVEIVLDSFLCLSLRNMW